MEDILKEIKFGDACKGDITDVGIGGGFGSGESLPTTDNKTVTTLNANITTFDISFNSATSSTNVDYQVYISTSSNICSDPATIRNNGTLIADIDTVQTVTATNLNAQTTYYANVIAYDQVGNETAYDCGSIQTLAEDVAPTAGDIYFTNTSDVQTTVNWDRSTDDYTPQSDLEYRVFRSSSNNIGTVSDMLANGTEVGTAELDIVSKVASGLDWGTEYWFNYMVTDGSGNSAAGNQASRTLLTPVSTYQITIDFIDGEYTGADIEVFDEAFGISGFLRLDNFNLDRVQYRLQNQAFEFTYEVSYWNTEDQTSQTSTLRAEMRRHVASGGGGYLDYWENLTQQDFTPYATDPGDCSNPNINQTLSIPSHNSNYIEFDYHDGGTEPDNPIVDVTQSTDGNGNAYYCTRQGTNLVITVDFIGIHNVDIVSGDTSTAGYNNTVTEVESKLVETSQI